VATHQSGGVRRATSNSTKSAQRSAESRKCPNCGRKSALKFHSDDFGFGSYCRWDDCDYERITPRDQAEESGP
jgi:ribosomal protein S27AE